MIEWVEEDDGALGAYGQRQLLYPLNPPQLYTPGMKLGPGQTRHWRIQIGELLTYYNGIPAEPLDVYMNQLQVQQHIRNVWMKYFFSGLGTTLVGPHVVRAIPAPNTLVPIGGAYGFETKDGQHIYVISAPLTAHVGPVGPVHGIEWLGRVVGLGDACGDVKAAADAAGKKVDALKAQRVDLDNAIITGQMNGQDTTDLEAQRAQLNQAITEATTQVAVLAGKAAIVCAAQQVVEPGGGGGGGGMNTTCSSDGDCTSDYECFKGNCVPRCPDGWTRQADGSCAQATAASTPSKSNWGLALLAAGAAAAVFFGFRSSSFAAPKRRQMQENPRRRYRKAA